MRITIRETAPTTPGFTAEIAFGDSPPYAVSVHDPFTPEEEARLGWYFEEWLTFPFTGTVKAEEAAASVTTYGESLFAQLFRADPDVLAAYKLALNAAGGYGALSFGVTGSPAFHALHWEALKDPAHGRPFAVECPFLRLNATPPNVHASVKPAPTLNVLLVTARPGGKQDVAYRTISRPLVEALATSQIRAQIDIVRPGTYRALVQHLERTRSERGDGYYHLIHFDLHGALLSYAQYLSGELTDALSALAYGGYAQPNIEAFEGQRAFLLFEGETPGTADRVMDEHLAGLLQSHQVPIAVLNACQSGKQVGAQETSLGSRLMAAGVQLVVAMGYSVTVSAAERLMQALYTALLDGRGLDQAIRGARLELFNQKQRRAAFGQTIALEDWLLPVVYQNRPTRLQLTGFATPADEAAYFARQAGRYRAPRVAYGFVGRDVDILEIEKRLLQADGGGANVLLVQGMGGAGKTTLLRHLMEWWQTTRLVREVVYFGYDEKAYALDQIADGVARQVYGERYPQAYQQMPSREAKLEKLVQTLRGERHLLVLDNLESITGAALAIQHTLGAAEQARLRDFVARLAGGRTLVLLGSRGPEAWLVDGLGGPRTELPGLDPEAASLLAERILTRHGVARYRSDPDHRDDLRRLLKLLDGYPLALEVVLANLAQQTPGAVLAAFEQGQAGLDAAAGGELWQDKTRSILRCVEYSHSNLAPDAQALLACLAPFTSVINRDWLPQYTAQLRQQPALSDLPFDRWDEVLQAAQNWGLLTPHEMGGGYLRLQPLLPYFLRERLGSADGAGRRDAVEAAFRAHYDGVGGALAQLITSKEPRERRLGQALIGLEFENLMTAVRFGLALQSEFYNAYEALFRFLNGQNAHQRAVELCVEALDYQKKYSRTQLAGHFGVQFYLVYHRLAGSYLEQKAFQKASDAYEEALILTSRLENVSDEIRGNYLASTYHQLGRVAEEQRDWPTAERHYQQALQIKIETNDRYSQASTYHQLGMVAEEQRDWPTAERHYQQALQIKIEFNDRYSQASTYHQLGMVAEEQRDWPTAERHYQQALQIYIEYKDGHGQARLHHSLGNVALEQRDWSTAERHYQQALQIKIETNDRYSQASTYHQLGMVAEEQRDWPTAERHYQQALQIYIEYNDRYAQAGTYHQLGRVAEEQRDWPTALNSFFNALETYVAFKDAHKRDIVLASLSRVWQASEDAAIPERVAAILGISPAEARRRLAEAG